ncbi:hypothetical protein QYE76_030105 [Lolium multiflorum]|uniref:BTB domain-containing protein n=1 Tax=Lolium multiflorum TaxID=4521 RepID=A0AAD8QRQ2_LOLMU|nr:hypothetical protein QYE76_030105 [Lolium multiflorum]
MLLLSAKRSTPPEGHVFLVRCYPRGSCENHGDKYLSLMLFLVSKSKTGKPIFDAFILDKDGAPSPFHAKRTTEDTIEDTQGAFLLRFMKRSDLESLYAANPVVTLVCGVIVRQENPMPMSASDIGRHLGRILDSTDGSDVSFYVRGKIFHAHRAVLAARSPVFKAELIGSMLEPKVPCVTVQGIDPVVFEALLRFLYTDALPAAGEDDGSQTNFYQHLLAAADHYALDRLKLVCAHKLWERASVYYTGGVLACAEMHDCRELKENCTDFFVAEKTFEKHVTFRQLVEKFQSILAQLRKKSGI